MVLHLFAVLVAASTLVLIFAGGLVTSTGSGLAVPDWPNTYGWFMFSFPLDKMVGGIFYEHGHRLIASTVGFLILVLAFWLWRSEPRRWVRRLGFLALAAVITQGVLGGITVLFYLPDPISISHAGLAQIVFCLTVTIALVTSRGWQRGYADGSGTTVPADDTLRTVAGITTALIYLQILVGATMRHTDAGLAIPDFPLAFGQLVPPHSRRSPSSRPS
jgi:cytochrome c oxidase assembly protein subunit 15